MMPASKFSAVPDWDQVPTDVLERLCESARLVTTARGDALFHRGDPEVGLYFVRSGEYKVSMLSPEGREQIVFLVGPDKLITDGILPSRDHCRVSVFAHENAAAWHVPPANLRQACRRSGELATALVSTMSHRTNRMLELIFDLSLRSVEQRVAAFLLLLVRRDGGRGGPGERIQRELKVNTVAGLLGTTREEFTRAQSKLQKAGIVAVSRQEVRVLDMAALERIAGEKG